MPRFYDALDAEAYFKAWTSLPFERTHPCSLSQIPSEPCDVIDIGAGSGRDARALAELGHRVVAVEPWEAMRNLAAERHSDLSITWIDDTLPRLAAVRALNIHFRFILVSAVWMHLDRVDRAEAMATVRDIADPTGAKVVITLRHPPDQTRGMFEVDADELISDARAQGFEMVGAFDHMTDPLARRGVTWSVVHLAIWRET